jgi:hypothetical protein
MDFRRKRRHEETVIDINDVLFSINRSIIRSIYDAKVSYIQDDDRGHIPKFIELSLLEMYRSDKDTIASFLLYCLKLESSSSTRGLSINGQLRGLSTRVMIDMLDWKSFKLAAFERHYDSFKAERLRKISNVLTPESKLDSTIEPFDAASIKRLLGLEHCQSKMFDRISNLYTSLAESADKILGLEKEKLDMQDTINSLESAIRRLQKATGVSKRRISASKGQMTKRSNALALETENRNTEWRRCESQLVKRAGYNKRAG